MSTPKKISRTVILKLLRVAHQLARNEKLPITVDETRIISTKEAHAIQAVGEAGHLNVSELANRFGITKSAASQTATRLCQKGYLEKRQAPHSNKELSLMLTGLGRKAFQAHERFHGEDFKHLLREAEHHSPEKLQVLSDLLDDFGGLLEKRLND